MTRHLAVTGLLLVAAIRVNAEIEPFVTNMAAQASFVVPSNKVLLIEHVFTEGTDPNFRIEKGALVARLKGIADDVKSFSPPVKVPGGWTVKNTAYDSSQHVFGLLVAPADLYAAIPSEFKALATVSGGLTGTIELGSPRPAQVSIDKTSELVSPDWTEELTALVERMSATQRKFTLPMPLEDNQFFRAKARAKK